MPERGPPCTASGSVSQHPLNTLTLNIPCSHTLLDIICIVTAHYPRSMRSRIGSDITNNFASSSSLPTPLPLLPCPSVPSSYPPPLSLCSPPPSPSLPPSSPGEGHFGDKSVGEVAGEYVEASRQNPHKFQPPRVSFVFCDGITESISRQ